MEGGPPAALGTSLPCKRLTLLLYRVSTIITTLEELAQYLKALRTEAAMATIVVVNSPDLCNLCDHWWCLLTM